MQMLCSHAEVHDGAPGGISCAKVAGGLHAVSVAGTGHGVEMLPRLLLPVSFSPKKPPQARLSSLHLPSSLHLTFTEVRKCNAIPR